FARFQELFRGHLKPTIFGGGAPLAHSLSRGLSCRPRKENLGRKKYSWRALSGISDEECNHLLEQKRRTLVHEGEPCRWQYTDAGDRPLPSKILFQRPFHHSARIQEGRLSLE